MDDESSTNKDKIADWLHQRLERLKSDHPDSHHIEPAINDTGRKIEFVNTLPEEVAFLLIEHTNRNPAGKPEFEWMNWSSQDRLYKLLNDFVSNKITITYGEQTVIHPLYKDRETSTYPPLHPVVIANVVANPSKYQLVTYPDNMWTISVLK